MQEPSDFEVDELEVPDETMYEVEQILRYHKRGIKNRIIWESLTVWARFSLEDASWEREEKFSDQKQLQDDIDAGLIKQDT